MTDLPAVSVVVPTYQRRELAVRAVASVLAQTRQDFELVVVDDGSNDGTAEALDGADERLRYVWQPNRGPAGARNAGIRLARAPIVAFLDSDDRWLPDHLAVVTEVLDRHPDAVLVSTCPRFAVAGREHPCRSSELDALFDTMVDCFGGYPSCIAARRSALHEVGGFDERMRVMEDCELWLRLSALGRFCILERRTIIHQDTRGSLVVRGIREGAYLEAEELAARSALALSSSLERPDRAALEHRARGRAALAAALRALARGEDDDARAALEQACRLVPDFSSAQDFVSRRMTKLSSSPRERLRILATAARLWPEPASDTSLFLRWKAAGLAVRQAAFLEAVRLAAGSPLLPLPSFLVRNRSRWSRIARRRLQSLRYRGHESTSLMASVAESGG